MEWGVASREMLDWVSGWIIRKFWRRRRCCGWNTRPDWLTRVDRVETLSSAMDFHCVSVVRLTIGHSKYGRFFNPRVKRETRSSFSSLDRPFPLTTVSTLFPLFGTTTFVISVVVSDLSAEVVSFVCCSKAARLDDFAAGCDGAALALLLLSFLSFDLLFRFV